MEEIKNDCKCIRNGDCLCEEDVLNDILMSEKNIINLYNTACTEMSNKHLYKKLLSLLNDAHNMARDIFNYMFEKGLCCVSVADEKKINTTFSDFDNKYKEL